MKVHRVVGYADDVDVDDDDYDDKCADVLLCYR